jgi:hypothetical protein
LIGGAVTGGAEGMRGGRAESAGSTLILGIVGRIFFPISSLFLFLPFR